MFYGAGGMAVARGVGSLGAAAGRKAWSNPLARRMAIGAGIGAGYGMLSRDTSMLGGGAMGAGIGAGYSTGRATGTAKLARQVWGGPGKFTNRLKIAARVQGALAKRYIGNNATKTYGQIRGLFQVIFVIPLSRSF